MMDQTGIMSRLEVERVYQRRLVPMVLEVITYSALQGRGAAAPDRLYRQAGGRGLL